jgi:hypothetical protein
MRNIAPVIYQLICLVLAIMWLVKGNSEISNTFVAASFVCGAILFK